MKAFGFTCSMGWIGGSGVVLAGYIEEVPAMVNHRFKDYPTFTPITLEDVQEATIDKPIVLLTDGDY